ncbi:biotin synthase BioB [Paenibacillus senegalensis]|uniref:biotin synthase BioB n=1 Tax=Paenibacillus senegalensis TaxID=1465766 RepID=UPI0002882D29|nr:biotin synthase BioB [Paenibacillus senegalensis]
MSTYPHTPTSNRDGLSPWLSMAYQVLAGKPLSDNQALSILEAHDDELLEVLQGAFILRKRYFGRKVKLNRILNAKSGLCPEDCGYCSQSAVSTAAIAKYSLLDKETIVNEAKLTLKQQIGTFCIVASGRGPSRREVEQVAAAVREIKQSMPLKICACLGILSAEQAQLLKEAGVDRYNHNLNTPREHFSQITTTHTYNDRVSTVNQAKLAGLSPCSGCIVGMGETKQELIQLARELHELDVDSIPVNFLMRIAGTPLAQQPAALTPRYALKVLALFRYICPSKEIRISGGRELHLRSLQALGLYAANSIFVGDYLTEEGQSSSQDHQMIEDLGFEIEVCAL